MKYSPSKKEDFNFFYITFLSIMSGKLLPVFTIKNIKFSSCMIFITCHFKFTIYLLICFCLWCLTPFKLFLNGSVSDGTLDLALYNNCQSFFLRSVYKGIKIVLIHYLRSPSINWLLRWLSEARLWGQNRKIEEFLSERKPTFNQDNCLINHGPPFRFELCVTTLVT